MIKKIVVLSISILSNLVYSEIEQTVECTGYDYSTEAPIIGKCSFKIGPMRSVGKFVGEDLETGEIIVGTCEPGEELDAWNYSTGELIIGECENLETHNQQSKGKKQSVVMRR